LGYISANAKLLQNINGIRLKIRKDIAEIDFWVRVVDNEVVKE
jgi:hypothetical protein